MIKSTPEEYPQKVCEKFNTSLQQVKKDVKVLKEWIMQQPHLPQTSSDELLTCFLISSKNSMERAKERIDNYYTVRRDIPYLFGDRDPEDERTRLVAKEQIFVHLPKFTPDGCRVIMARLVTGDAAKYDLPVILKLLLALLDIRHNTEPFSMGEYVVIDANRFGASHLACYTPTLIRDFAYCIQDAMPLNIKYIIVFNAPKYAQMAASLIKPFLRKKLMERFHVHTEGTEILEKYLPRKMLPRDYGGEEESSEKLNEAWLKLFREKRDWLLTEGSVTVDERKSIGGPNTRRSVNMQEMQGSFKALCVD